MPSLLKPYCFSSSAIDASSVAFCSSFSASWARVASTTSAGALSANPGLPRRPSKPPMSLTSFLSCVDRRSSSFLTSLAKSCWGRKTSSPSDTTNCTASSSITASLLLLTTVTLSGSTFANNARAFVSLLITSANASSLQIIVGPVFIAGSMLYSALMFLIALTSSFQSLNSATASASCASCVPSIDGYASVIRARSLPSVLNSFCHKYSVTCGTKGCSNFKQTSKEYDRARCDASWSSSDRVLLTSTYQSANSS